MPEETPLAVDYPEEQEHSTKTPLNRSSSLMLLSDDLCEEVLPFLVADLASWKNMSVVSRRLRTISYSPASWIDASIQLPGAAMASEQMKHVLKLAPSWRLAKSLSLKAHPKRQPFMAELKQICPELDISIAAQGPYLLFVMGGRCAIGEHMGLHFFEPRYRWMCRRVFEGERPHVFGFVTSGGSCPGSTGVLCEVSQFRENYDGTFDVLFVARARFSLLEVWTEKVPEQPHAPPLAVGLLDVDDPSGTACSSAASLAQRSGHVGYASRIFRIFRPQCSRVLRCFLGVLLCRRRRG